MKQRYVNILTKLIALQALILSGSITLSGQAPIANFSGSPVSGCLPLIVTFQDLSTGNPTSWNWNFGNGNTSVLRNPTATYFTPGTYTVTLTVTNASGTNTLTRTGYITVFSSPTVDFSASSTSGCFPKVVQFQDLSTPGAGNTNVAWLWDFGNGNTSTLQNPIAVYNSAGSFSVTLRVTNDKGCVRVLSRPNYITVTNGVDAAFNNTPPTSCSAPASVTFVNNTTGPPILSYAWDFGDGNVSSAANPTHTYTANGTFTVTLIATSSAGCQDTIRHSVVIGGNITSFSGPSAVCIGGTATFTNTSNPLPASARWDFGDGGTANGLNATHTYTTAGTYTVRLYNTYGACNDSASQTINVVPNPVIDFTAPVTSRCQPPLTVNFQDLTPGSVSWEWDFGDGATSNIQNPTHTYTVFGSYTVKLIVTNSTGCVDSLIRPNYIIIRSPQISMPDFPVRACIPYTHTFNPVINTVDAITSYSWDFGDGGTSTLPNPSHTYTVLGIYDVRLIITTSSGCTKDTLFTDAVRVGTKPIANFTGGPSPVCANEPVQFTDLSAPADEWNWDFGDGNSSIQQNPSHQYRDTGYFNVRLIAYNSGCADTIIRNSYIYVLPPVARYDIVPDCTNRLNFSFTDRSIAPLSWNWDFGDGGTSTLPNPSHTFPALGNYNVRLIVTNGGCADTIIQVVKALNEQPDFFADFTSGCKTVNITFHATNLTPRVITDYFWDFGDGGTANNTTPDMNHTYVFSGNYDITLTVTDINGCTNSRTTPNYIRINGPIADFSSTNASGCSGSLTTVFDDLSATDGVNNIVNWYFDFGDGTTQNFSAPPFQHTYTSVDSFTVKMIITDAAGCKDSITRTNMVVTTDPTVSFYAGITVSCPGGPINFSNLSTPLSASSYVWHFGDGNTSTLREPQHTYTAPGLYTVKLVMTDPGGCADSLIRTDYIYIGAPLVNFTMSDSVSSCTPFEVQFTNTSNFYNDSYWDFGPGEGTSRLANPVHIYGTPGVYVVQLKIVSPGGCPDSITKTITVYDTAGSTFDYLPQGGCSPLTVNLNGFSPGPMVTYFWDFGDGYTQTTTTPNASHVYATYGDFVPKLIMEDESGCLVPMQGFDTIYVTGADARFGQSDSLFCDFGTVNFLDSTTFNDPVVSYNWSFGDGGSSTLQNPVHTYSTPGLYTVQLRVRTTQGCLDTLTKTQLVAVVESPSIAITGDTSLCINTSALHNGIFNRPDTSQVLWSWSFPNGTGSTLQNPPAQLYNTAGTYTITAIATNSTGCQDTARQRITIYPLPTVIMPAQMTVQNGFPVTLPATYSPSTVSWLWTPATGLSCSTCPTPDVGPKFNTIYQLQFSDVNGCTNSSSLQVFVLCKNLNLFIPNTFSPNGDGNNEVFYPRGRGLERVKLLRIFNRWGEVVFEKHNVPVNDPSGGWDGTFRGRKPMADVYVYQAEVFCENGELIKLNGNIALIL